jgi:hypothetical protein
MSIPARRPASWSSVAYVLAWIAGLSVDAPRPPIDALGTSVHAVIAVQTLRFILSDEWVFATTAQKLGVTAAADRARLEKRPPWSGHSHSIVAGGFPDMS